MGKSTKKSDRVRKIRQKYGADIFRSWGKKGGNPILIKQGKRK